MREKQGFTLIEVILSLAILGIISMYFLGAIANHFRFLTQTKEITEDVFLVQRKMEEEIDLVKQEIIDLKSGVTISSPRELKRKTIFSSDLGGIEVSYYEVKQTLNNKDYFTLVSNIKPDPLELLTLERVDSKLKHQATTTKYGYTKTPDFSIVGNFKNIDADKYDHLLSQVEWYVANKKFNMPVPRDFDMNENLEYNSNYFPIFPKDYELIDNETVFKFGTNFSTFNKLSEFGGRHILYAVTPAAKSGKLGVQKISESGPIFISGLPLTKIPAKHFDASYIDVTSNNEVNNDWSVKKWIDLSSVIRNVSPEEFANISAGPMVKRTDIGAGFIGQYLRFLGNQKLNTNKGIGEIFTVISVVKNYSVAEETEYLRNGDTVLKLDPNLEGNDHKWRVEYDVISAKDNEFIIGGSNVDIAEMIFYGGILETTIRNEIETYLVEKYIDPIVTGDMLKFKDESKLIEIEVGNDYVLPTMLRAEMYNGTYKDVCVRWLNPDNLNINVEGEYTVIGTALADSTKVTTYTIAVGTKESP